jgi:long-chain acyl-CoA synthetase
MYHSAPNAYGLQIVRNQGLLVLQPRFDAEELLRLIQKFRITHLHVVPTMFVRLLGLADEIRRQYDVSSLVHVAHGAAPCPEDVKRAMIDWWGPVINEYYAMTEIGIATTSTSEDWLTYPGTVGRAARGVTLKVIDGEGRACIAGQAGEILVCSEATTRFSYHRADEKTRAARHGDFVATGDVGYLNEDGYLFISDRLTDMVISGGVNIYPAEVENALLTYPGIKDCAVFGVPDHEFGERLVAVIESAEPFSDDSLTSYLAQHIAGFKVPREFVFTDSLPREDSGKIRKKLVAERFQTGEFSSYSES